MLTVIIAEKPSLARNIVAGIGNMKKRDGYYENDEYIVTWAFGHLFSLVDVEAYAQGDKNTENGSVKWTMENLPCFPEQFRFEIRRGDDKRRDPGVIKQFNTIKYLLNRNDVSRIANAGDADREGEIIVRLCIENANPPKDKERVRLWLPDQTPQTIAAALADMKNESEYDNLANEGFARTYMDWLYGVNLTRYATLKTGNLLRVGRVIVPIVRAVYDRDMQIKNFVPDKYFAIISRANTNGETVELTSKLKFSSGESDKAKVLCDEYNSLTANVTSKKVKKDTISPGKLYSLSKLQNVLGKKYKMPMDESLSIVQKLYEDGYITYPRTNSEYLAVAEKDKIAQIISNLKKIGYPIKFRDSKQIFDDSKIESHSALTPTYKIPDKSKLSEKEMTVYSTVVRRFAAVFCEEPCLAEKTEITVSLKDKEAFILKGTVITQKGWTKLDDYTAKDKILPPLEEGDRVNIDFQPVEKETNPPKHYTIETLNNYLKNPFKEDKKQQSDDDGDDDEYRAVFEGLELGTEATRTGIIDNALKSKYIELKKDVYYILPKGIFLIESLRYMNISMDKYKTSELGRSLKKVYRGEIAVSDSVKLAQKEISEMMRRSDMPPETDTDYGFIGDEVGTCPMCGAPVRRTSFGYGCSGYKNGCRFSVNFVICHRVISKSNMKMLLSNGRSSKIKGFTSKKGNSFDAYLKLDENKKVVFDFSQ
ncbi:MAG: DNA topoisomerase [Eubacteriales bacterium]|nr:DNA topoisomerase [Eubacteriales bacterium]